MTASLFGALGIAAADDAEKVGHRFIGGSDRFFVVGPGGNGLANDFGSRDPFAAGQTRDALPGFLVEAEGERVWHGLPVFLV